MKTKAVSAIGSAVLLGSVLMSCAPATVPSEKASKPGVHGVADAVAQTEALMALHKRWARASAEEQTAVHERLVAQVMRRREVLAELLRERPADVLRVMIPADKLTDLPSDVRSQLERPMDAQGTLETVEEDFANGSHRLRHFLRADSGARLEVHFVRRGREWRSGLSVRAHGWLLEASGGGPIQGDLVLEDDEHALAFAGATEDGSGDGSLAYAMPNAMGAQRTLAILVNFEDDPNNKPWTVNQANSLFFGSGGVSDFFKENSYQQTWLTGSVAGWYTLPISSTTCDGFAIANHAKAAAQGSGFNLANYDRFVYVFPKNACGYAGMAQVGAFPSSTWINNSMILHTVAHEMGHNLGLQHAHALDCGDTTLGSTCTSQGYGDTLDVMGYFGTVGHYNVFNKERLGWLSSQNVVDVTSSGDYSLQPASSAQTSAAKVLKIANGTDASGAPSYYYVEFRQPLGFDAQLPDRGIIDTNNIFNGVVIRRASPSDGNSGYLLDMTAGTDILDMMDPALTAGRTFSDPGAGITITTASTSSSQATVHVDLAGGGGTPICTRQTPSVSLTPGQSSWLPAGSSFSYSVTIKNQDSSACASSNFSLTASKPSGWSASLGSSSLTLAPGASASTTLTTTAPSTAIDGFYSVGVTAAANGLSASGSATFVVDNPVTSANQAPRAVDDSVTLTSIAPITIDVLANDSDPDADALSIASFGQGTKGSVSLSGNGTLVYTPAKAFKSSDQFSYTISDGKLMSTATVYVSLQSGGKGGNKGAR